jgi:hypothetical protein
MATSTTPQPYTADRPENSTTSVDANCPKAVISSEERSGTIPALNSPLENLSARELPLDEARERAGFGAGLSSGRKECP